MPIFWRKSLPGESPAEQRLVKAARSGDRAAFDTLVYAHQNRLRAFLVRRVGPDSADDVLQETFLGAWQAAPRLDLRVRFKTWLFGIAVHKAADLCRSRGRRGEIEVALEPVYLEAAGHTEDGFISLERRETIKAIFERLNDDQRQLLEMYYFAELTLPEIATILKRNLNTVKYQFYRAHTVAADKGAEWSDTGGDMETKPGVSTSQTNTQERRRNY